MINFNNKIDLEKYFANHFDTVFFPVLADIYMSEDDFARAKKVCEIGLEHNPGNINGVVVLADVYHKEGDLKSAEKLLEFVVGAEPSHYRATVTLATIQTQLNRSSAIISKLWKKVLELNPSHAEAVEFFKTPQLNNTEILQSDKKDSDDLSELIENEKSKDLSNIEGNLMPDESSQSEEIFSPKIRPLKPQNINEEQLQSLKISSRMATFTMVNILKNQKLYQQALSVLKLLEEKGADPALIKQERQSLKKLVKDSE